MHDVHSKPNFTNSFINNCSKLSVLGSFRVNASYRSNVTFLGFLNKDFRLVRYCFVVVSFFLYFLGFEKTCLAAVVLLLHNVGIAFPIGLVSLGCVFLSPFILSLKPGLSGFLTRGDCAFNHFCKLMPSLPIFLRNNCWFHIGGSAYIFCGKGVVFGAAGCAMLYPWYILNDYGSWCVLRLTLTLNRGAIVEEYFWKKTVSRSRLSKISWSLFNKILAA